MKLGKSAAFASLFAIACCLDTASAVAQSMHADAAEADAPMIRWWWPNAQVDLDEIDRELKAVKDAGFAGVEIVSLPHKLKVDPVQYGWGSSAWNSAMAHTLRKAAALGLRVDLTIGPAWPAVIPGLSPDAPEAEKILVHGMQRLTGGQALADAPLPDKAAPATVKARRLEALVAYPVTGEDQGKPVIDMTQAVDLTESRAQGWTAPAGDWLVMAFWMRGTGQMDNMRPIERDAPNLTEPPAFVVDHFSRAGASIVTDYWDKHLLTGGIGAMLRKVDGGIFEDSLELYGSPLWTPGFFAEFETRHGYSLRPWMAALFLNSRTALGEPTFDGPPEGLAGEGADGQMPPPGPPAPKFPFATDPETRDRVLEDYEATLSDLYIENRIGTIKAWAKKRGLHFRNQGYGPPIDSAKAAAATDIPEGESLAFGDATDSFRVIAAGRDMAGTSKILSDECCADFDSGYGMTWRRMLHTIHGNYAAGVNQIVVHGLSYGDGKLQGDWPGWAPMVPFGPLGSGFAEAWGPRLPTWQHMKAITTYLARTQNLLRAGKPKVDVAIYRLAYQTNELPLSDPALAQAGYSYGMLSPGLFDHPNAVVRDGVLAPDGAGYRALIFEAPERVRLDAMERMLAFAKSGLPIVLVGPPPKGISGFAKPGEKKRLDEILAALPQQKTVANAQTFEAVASALHKLGVDPAAAPDNPAPFTAVHRRQGASDFYWLLNTGKRAETRRITLTGTGTPSRLDLWSGKRKALGAYMVGNGTVTFALTLRPDESAAFELSGTDHRKPHVMHTTAEEVRLVDGGLLAMSRASGTFEARDEEGRLVATVPALPGTIDLTGGAWTLDYEDWRPGAAANETRKGRRTITLSGLRPWTAIPGLEDVGGIGRYSTRFEVAGGASGYILELGEATDTVRVKVNGDPVSIDLVTHRADLGSLVRPGANSLEVEVATPLLNRLRTTQPDPFAKKPRIDVGLIGPVRLVPYGLAAFQRADDGVVRPLPRASAQGIDVCPFVAEADSDGDGQMSESEWLAKVVGPPVDVFRGFDHDGDGLVSCDEMDQNGPPPGGFDTNGDGKLSIGELNAIVAKLAPKMQGD